MKVRFLREYKINPLSTNSQIKKKLNKYFSIKELEIADSKHTKEQFLIARLAAKQAVRDCMHFSAGIELSLYEIQILRHLNGSPKVQIDSSIPVGKRIPFVTLSHTQQKVIAIAWI